MHRDLVCPPLPIQNGAEDHELQTGTLDIHPLHEWACAGVSATASHMSPINTQKNPRVGKRLVQSEKI
jgi:hypothetical protein